MRAAWGVIFDWDGVVVDSSAQHEASWERLAREEGRQLPAGHFQRGFGRKNDYIIPQLLNWTQDPAEVRHLSDRKEALYRRIIEEGGLRALPGVVEWVRRLRQAGIPCAVGSSTPRLNITCVLERVGLQEAFEAIVSSEDVERGKPDPQVFLLAAQRLGLSPRRCVVFEDMPVGIQAAKAAGMTVIAVTTSRPASELQAADRVVGRLDVLSVSEVADGLD